MLPCNLLFLRKKRISMFNKIVLFTILIIGVVSAENPSYHIFKNEKPHERTAGDYAIGSSLLITEYIAVPLFMKSIWWEEGWEMRNPFRQKKEMEPYHVDESWHAVMNCSMQDLHYTVLRKYFGVESPYPSMGLTLFSWTMVEVLDALEINDQWGFSINDEIGNSLGLLVWLIHHKYPDFKFYIRGGVRTWDGAADYGLNVHKFFTDSDEYYRKYGKDKYSLSKVEYIYKWHDQFYSGIAVSKSDVDEDLFGFTVGWDGLSYLNESKEGWWNYPGRLFGNTFSLSLAFTIWHSYDYTLTPF